MGRKIIDPALKKKVFSVKLSPRAISRIDAICRRKSVKRMKRFSQAQLIESLVMLQKLPASVTPEQEAAYDNMQAEMRAKRLSGGGGNSEE